MGADKLVDSTELNSDLTSVADAIRSQGGTSASLVFPSGFVSAIEEISTGSGGVPTRVKQAIFTLLEAAAYAQTGLTDEIAIIESWATGVQYSVTNSLTNVTNSNSSTLVDENDSYIATLTSDAGYRIDSVTVTMGGVDITSQVFTPSA